MFTKILLASDGSDCALKAAAQAAALAQKFGAPLTVIAVFDAPGAHAPFALAPYRALEPDRPEVATVQDAVLARTGRVIDEADVSYETRRAFGHPAEEIVRAAEAEHADLIVLGSRGLSGVKSFLLGSVSDRVAHQAHCPVLIVR